MRRKRRKRRRRRRNAKSGHFLEFAPNRGLAKTLWKMARRSQGNHSRRRAAVVGDSEETSETTLVSVCVRARVVNGKHLIRAYLRRASLTCHSCGSGQGRRQHRIFRIEIRRSCRRRHICSGGGRRWTGRRGRGIGGQRRSSRRGRRILWRRLRRGSVMEGSRSCRVEFRFEINLALISRLSPYLY